MMTSTTKESKRQSFCLIASSASAQVLKNWLIASTINVRTEPLIPAPEATYPASYPHRKSACHCSARATRDWAGSSMVNSRGSPAKAPPRNSGRPPIGRWRTNKILSQVG
jgi:hypothetical protein